MALRVWLPLNGNINNQGLSENNAFIEGSVPFENGKLGKAASFVATSAFNRIKVPGLNLTTFSVCLWFMIPQAVTATAVAINEGRDYNTYGWEVYVSSANKITLKCGNNLYNNENCTPNVWYHACITCNEDGEKKYYINGELKYTTSGSLPDYSESNGYINIGNFGYGTSDNHIYPFNGYINDVRIYDEVLSPKQIKEISKGLVAHYKLTGVGANPNLIPSSFSSGWSSNGSSNTYTKLDDYSFSIQYTAETIGGSAGRYKGINGYFTAGKTYTFSYEIKGDGAYQIKAGFEPSANIVTTTTDFKKYYCTYTATTTNWCAIVFYSNGTHNLTTGSTITVRNMKLEEGNICTNYIPNEEDILYIKLGYENDICIDLSGYEYTATKSGTLTFNSDSPRYDGCNNFSTASTYLKLPTLNTIGFANSFTIVYWAKITDMNGKMAWGFEDGNRLNIYPTGSVICCNTGDRANNPYQKDGISIGFSQWNNGWHQFAMTADGTSNKLYVDGVLQGTAKTYKGITGTQIYLSGWASSNSYRWTGGSISDFRIYATALSADDILTMYKNSGIIDNKGNVYAYEFKEE